MHRRPGDGLGGNGRDACHAMTSVDNDTVPLAGAW